MTDTARLAEAVARLRAGDVVAFPTETVYGLGADARNPAAVARVFALKGRPTDHPLIVHIASAALLPRWAAPVPPAARALAAAFWPGPLTLILPRAAGVPDAVTGGQPTVGVRCPAHPLAHALLEACLAVGIDGLAAPSANRFGHVSPTTADHVRGEFGPQVLVLDGGPADVGIESTIVDLSRDAPRVLRPGMLDTARLAAVIGGEFAPAGADAPRVSGSLAAHYAPATPLELLPGDALIARIQALSATGIPFAALVYGPVPEPPPAGLQVLRLPAEPAGYARALYARLREADALGVARILVEAPPADLPWLAIRDRLRRAAQGSGRS
ncbi:MAG: L-threonylcarbamoyladenylate synthase [Gammaproteobacteria bacterium]